MTDDRGEEFGERSENAFSLPDDLRNWDAKGVKTSHPRVRPTESGEL